MTPIINIATWNASTLYPLKNATIDTILLLAIVLAVGIWQEVIL